MLRRECSYCSLCPCEAGQHGNGPGMLTVFSIGGLCNRLSAIHSAICLSKDIGQPLRVVWKVNPDLGCRFDRLLVKPNEVSQLLHFERRSASFAQKVKEIPTRWLCWPPLHSNFGHQDIAAMHKAKYDFLKFAGRPHTQFQSLSLFYGENRPFYNFQPVAELSDRISALGEKIDGAIGIHVRRTDHKPSTEYSHTELFIHKIETIIERDTDQRFFLATDDPHEEATLRRRFPGRIQSLEKRSYDRSREEAIEDALVDLFCLSRTKRIIGSFASTFSTVAGRIGGIPVEYVQSQPDAVAKW